MTFKISGLPEVLSFLIKKAELAKNTSQLMSNVGDIIVKDVQKRIKDTKVSPEGSAWTPWAPSTLAARTKDGSVGLGLLFKTGRLHNSITSLVKSKTSFSVSSSAPYAGYLQEGTDNMPARPFLGVSSSAREAINNAIKEHMSK